MAVLSTREKLAILSDAAKYDASCASSGAGGRDSLKSGGIGSTEGMGICHSYAPDGRCISLLKILLTNFCIYDCSYCINRSSSNVRRARFTVDEVVRLTMDFYKRNYIEGLFLSSGVIRSPDETMTEMVEVARRLRLDEKFAGYIHLKTIPEASAELIEKAGLYADRLSINVELPTDEGVKRLAPEKRPETIRVSMAKLRSKIEEKAEPTLRTKTRERFAPGGQSTQMIVGADATSDARILKTSARLYGSYQLRRVYYSAFSPIPDASSALPLRKPPLMREHRLYQADWLMRFYGFEQGEILDGTPDGMLDLEIDPKLAWALRNRASFPLDVNRADKERLLRIPGLGTRAVERILETRRFKRLRLEDVGRLCQSITKVRPFIVADGWSPGAATDAARLREAIAPKPRQLELFR
ncbi:MULTISPECIES: putative DNA modification/repair radical SAM protein [Aminobacter]|jgi:putative DNA modification/repair radical SAM protein|uniref:Biotin synthase n=1 Tax=Aminobacter aminovorans TaxID=83263 RepID=A0AAC8YM11_AMIAI|nr:MULTISPECIES: putative DNA modification/repair radical SAM protein [Aminobacter]AMS40837.1 biotin synthase [Aminobacter aminovorans]MBB3708974.1 putative DNA modification/repair radical SAM protein [Aminobacter aminovorans]MRX35624.1 putative DNA modification/repair radical SAM protein [Aminobacter sp. MDW-2]QNH36248.1 putative DNA modification/repair radical SAM protein [Aminobacter sp. MDW-2]WMC95972.1 putative DNA modification/repair radical SAM protein [Aminobacter aminovorans]